MHRKSIRTGRAIEPDLMPPRSARIHGLYAITPECADAKKLVQMTEAALRGGAAAIQYRQKHQSTASQLEQARALLDLCNAYQRLLIVNDDVELAKAIGATGVHLGRADDSILQARETLGKDRIIGMSCYNELDRAASALADGADYIAFGSVFPSSVKPDAVRAELQFVSHARKRFPHANIVAIGGITLQNAPLLIETGVDAVAVISDVFSASDIAGQARAFHSLFENHVRK
jgi:thiamine-phosphate pyrophosphorylase